MASWMITGAGKNKTTSFGGGSIACKTSFKSWMKVKNLEGKTITPIVEKGEYVFREVKPGDTIIYEAFTGADAGNGNSDEIYVVATSLNWAYLINLMNQINLEASSEQIEMWESNPQSYNDYILSKADVNRLLITTFGGIENTDSQGIYRSSLKIPTTWASGPLQVSLMYGYNNDSKASNLSRLGMNLFEVANWVAFGVSLIVSCAATAGIGCAIALGAITAIELGQLTYQQLSQGLMANIGRNKYGCSFPNSGYVHTYNFNLINSNNDPFMNIDESSIPKNQGSNISQINNLFNSKVALFTIALAGFFIALESVVRSE